MPRSTDHDPDAKSLPPPRSLWSRADLARSWQRCRALAWKEFQVVFGRRHFWLLQSLFVGYLAAVTLYSLHLSQGWSTSYRVVEEMSEGMIRTLSLFSYLALLFFAPAMAAGALQEEKESGMLEVLEAAPVTRRQLFFGLVGARLLLISQYLLAGLPLLLFPVIIGGVSASAILGRSLATILLGATLTTLYTMSLFTEGRSTPFVYSRLAIFVLITPFAWGFATFLRLFFGAFGLGLCITFGLGSPWGGEFVRVAFAAWFPFWSLGIAILHGPEIEPVVSTTGWAAGIIACVVYARVTRENLESWLRSQTERGGFREVRNKRRRSWGERKGKLQKLLSSPGVEAVDRDVDEGESEIPENSDEKPLLATRIIERLRGMQRWTYRWSGGNPMVVRSALERSQEFVLVWTSAFIVAVAGAMQILDGSTSSRIWLGVLNILSFFVVVVVVAVKSGRLLPSRRRAHTPDVFFSAPLTGSRIAAGHAWVAWQQSWPLVAIVVVLHLWPTIERDHYVWAWPSLFLFVATLALTTGITASSNLVRHRVGQRLAASAVTLTLVIFPAFFLAREPRMIYHPLRAWSAAPGATPEQLWWSLAGVSTLGVVVWGGFVFAYGRLSRRA